MKKILLLLLVAFLLVGCNRQETEINENTPDADLSEMTMSGLAIGDNINDIDLTQFTNNNGNPLWTYSFDEVYIKTDNNGIVIKLLSSSKNTNVFADDEINPPISTVKVFSVRVVAIHLIENRD